ncbi:uncharacterized protein N7511_006575 [Penicillium nucicola]|uniref:uncharacterized protein n=1 Tax=Penicillium nucicola TaxID=1850975 RepID=UPI0025459850|nr:uncharacterized protein N7511_006575 [Penicillium nucicola]KAJ5757881.1 hypothetical protein N7511_006575 [Penicillium nucicola]
MADALCGPSNALQNFQKHTSVDRTLQQDRLSSKQSPTQGFRSQNPREGILDPEFAAFEANTAGPALPDLQHPAHFGGPAQHYTAQHPVHHPANASWASDFQNLQISGPSHPVSQLQRPNIAPATAHGGWQNEFMNQHQRVPMSQAQQNPQMLGGYQASFAPSYPMYGAMNQLQPPQAMQPEQQKPMEQFDESAFEAAFDQARADMELQGADLTRQNTQQTLDSDKVDAVEPIAQEQIRLGSDLIPQSDKEDPQTRARDADELARTAGQLLDSVRNEQSTKFQQSNFLALMRRIRDREVEVEGDEFRETAQSLHPGGPYYPGQPYPDPAITPSSKEPPLPTGTDVKRL